MCVCVCVCVCVYVYSTTTAMAIGFVLLELYKQVDSYLDIYIERDRWID